MAVHATSLSELNELAAHPPQYPHNPTEEQREPLTLYISRVPGTRDIILSTFKPLRKNVTAEDVANALYYVHLNLPSDNLLALQTAGAYDHASPRSSMDHQGSPVSSIQRKPLPSVPATATTSAAVTTAPAAPTVTTPPQLSRDLPPAPPLHQPQPVQPLLQEPQKQQQQKPEPWVPPGYQIDQSHLYEPPAMSTVRNSISRKPVGSLPSRPTSSSNVQPPSNNAQPPSNNVQPPSPPPRSQSPVLVPFHLTLIRRDPSSNHQWNIGKISSLQPVEPLPMDDSNESLSPDRASCDLQDRPARPGHPGHPGRPESPPPAIRIQLDSSGYTKFRGFPTRHSVESASRDLLPCSVPRQLAAASSSFHDARDVHDLGVRDIRDARDVREAPDTAFTRHVVMSYGKSWTANIRNAFRRHDRAVSDMGPFQDSEQAPALTSGQSSPDSGVTEMPLITRPGPGLKPRGYVFSSPWDGQCEFRTGNGGRSLKCRHFVHAAGGASGGGSGVGGFNPLVISQGLRDGQSIAAVAANATGGRTRAGSLTSVITGALPVSELRFNLPSGDLFHSPHSPHSPGSGNNGSGINGNGGNIVNGSGTGVGNGNGLRADLHAWVHQRHPSDEDDYEYESDEAASVLGVGREAAGGGNRGKRAKLGKLIVYHDGFKMLDLVVAANIGMWWVSWERSF